MGFFLYYLREILIDFGKPSIKYHHTKEDWGTPSEIFGFFIRFFGVLAFLAIWLIGIPYYFHNIQGYSGWGTFGMWWLATVFMSVIISIFNPKL